MSQRSGLFTWRIKLQIPITAFNGSQKHTTVNCSVVQPPFSHSKTLVKLKKTKPQTATTTKTQKTPQLNKQPNQPSKRDKLATRLAVVGFNFFSNEPLKVSHFVMCI